MEEITKQFEEAKESNSSDLEDIEYVMLKEQVFVAKCLNKLKDFTKAEDVCDDILEVLKEKTEVSKAHKFALKALYMKAKNMTNLMEFRYAKKHLEDEAKPILK